MWLTLKEKKTVSEDPPHTYPEVRQNFKAAPLELYCPTDVKELFKAEARSGKKRSFEEFHICSA